MTPGTVEIPLTVLYTVMCGANYNMTNSQNDHATSIKSMDKNLTTIVKALYANVNGFPQLTHPAEHPMIKAIAAYGFTIMTRLFRART